jgi:hypothetical protein
VNAGLLPILADGLGVKPQRIAVIVTLLFLALVIELVRRRRLVERYALLWISAALVLVVLAVWNGALNWIADRLGILSPPNALFLIGVGALFVLALHFSVAFSRLSEETKILAQEVARLDREQRLPHREREQDRGREHPQQRVALHEPPAPDELEHDPEQAERGEDRDELAHAGPLPSTLGSTAAWVSAAGGGAPSKASGRRRSRPTNRASITLTM